MFANEILIIFRQDFTLPKLLVTSDFKGQSPSQLTCKKDEIILLISKTVQGYVTHANYHYLNQDFGGYSLVSYQASWELVTL